MSNYPHGTGANDPLAPWNDTRETFKKDHYGICDCCDKDNHLNDDNLCEACFDDLDYYESEEDICDDYFNKEIE